MCTASDSGGQAEESGNLCKDWGIYEWGKIDVNQSKNSCGYAVKANDTDAPWA
jgi:hypothetical protein